MKTPRHRRYGGSARTTLADYIAENARTWVSSWLEEVRRDPATAHYASYGDTEELIRDTEALYHYLALWLRTGSWDPRIDTHYHRIGRDRRERGFPLGEVARAILLAKRHLWKGIADEQRLSVALELEMAKAIAMFYDEAIYHTILGYEGRDT